MKSHFLCRAGKNSSNEPSGKPIKLEIKLNIILLNEVQVVADVAIDRKTPVAFSTIPLKKINENCTRYSNGPQSTPGVYATQQGGGDGDARITIRGLINEM